MDEKMESLIGPGAQKEVNSLFDRITKRVYREAWGVLYIIVPLTICVILLVALIGIKTYYNPQAFLKRSIFKEYVKPKNKASAILLLEADKGRLFEVIAGEKTKYYYLPKDKEPKAGKIIITQMFLNSRFAIEITELANFTQIVRGGRTYVPLKENVVEWGK